ncbi:hypothetical protein C0991_005663, partial [Blastosporella zonata]
MDTLNHPTSSLLTSRLKQFCTVIEDDDCNNFLGFLVAAPSLENIQIEFMGEPSHDSVVDISNLVNLRVIHIVIYPPTFTSLRFAVITFEIIPEQNLIEEVHLTMAESGLLEPHDEEALKMLDDLLTRERHAK